MKRLVLIDGNALLHRAFHATPPLATSKGELVNAVYGFTLMLIKAIEELHPDYMAIAWDMRAPTFRHTQFEGYKAQRKPADEGLTCQYERVFEVVKAFNIPEFKLPGFEADDLVGTLARLAKKKEKALEVIIMTGDRDIMQLIDKRVKVFMPKKTLNDVGLYGEEEFVARFGFEPKQIVDYKALAGDASDNVPGVPGVGEVTATKLIQKYGSLEKVYKQVSLAGQDKHLDELPERLKKLLEEGKESAFMSKELVTLQTEIPIELNLGKCRVSDFDPDKVRSLFEELEFRSLIGKIPGVNQKDSERLRKPEKSDNSGNLIFRSSDSSGTPNSSESFQTNTTNLDHAVEPILQQMSEVGVMVDTPYLNQLGQQLKDKLAKIEQEIYSIIGHQFNLNSPKQLSEVLFDELKLPLVKKTKTGRSTDEETLHELHDHHPVVPLLLEYRQLFKLVSTYIDALPKHVKEDGRIHSQFNVEGAATGRVSSQDPNLQNIPISNEIGAKIRKAFVAPSGKVFLGADYSQIELRIMAHLASDPGLLKAFQEGQDVHTATAAKIFNIPVSEVTKQQRSIGKTMNFATLYGQGPRALSRGLGVDYKTAQQYIADYFTQFPKVKDWMARTLEEAYKCGFVETLWGRRRYIPELKSPNRVFKAFGERAATNMPVQGSAADMIKKAMVNIDQELREKGIGCQMILQVHDELLFECDPKSVEEIAGMVREKMENALKLDVPVKVDLKVGPNWGEMKPLNT